ncbi:MAG TPA: glycosyltransferase [Acidobacteriaceae bacterium]|nr:glycosyltransferase [Acidobacteriaceae bacterium]
MNHLHLVIPVFDDWPSLQMLLTEIDRLADETGLRMAVTVVNDGSNTPADPWIPELAALRHIEKLELLHLFTNMGHQRAIAIGLCAAVEEDDAEAIMILDADGEDSPAAIPKFLEAARNSRDFCVVARRGKRIESLTFKASYRLYKLLFRILTGKQINFGNFCLLSRNYARRLVRVAELWNNLPAAVLRSKLPIHSIEVDRTQRYAGKSKMNLTSLVVHGLSGISVYAETIFVRLLISVLGLFGLSAVTILTVAVLRFFFPLHATPGWATTVSFGVIIILVQALSLTLSFILMLLNSRVQRSIIPFAEYAAFIDCRQNLLGAQDDDRPISASANAVAVAVEALLRR